MSTHFKSHQTGENPITKYLMKHGFRENAALREIVEVTVKETTMAVMILDELEGQLLHFLLKTMNAKKCLEVGVFTGYNCVNMAMAIPDDGKVVGLDINEQYLNIGRPIWKKYGVDKKIEVIIGDAKKSMQTLIENGEGGTYDFVLIDADKSDYDHYYEKALQLLRVNGIIAVDNVLYAGKVAEDEDQHDKNTKAIHTLNKKILEDKRVEISMTAVGDGLTLCRKL